MLELKNYTQEYAPLYGDSDLVYFAGGEMEVIKAKIRLKTEQKDLVVYSISPEGFIQGNVPAKYENGVLSFEVGECWRSMYYLIQTN